LNILKDVGVVNGGWHHPFLFITNFPNCSTQYLSTPCLGKLIHEDDSNESGKSSNIVTDLIVNLYFELVLFLQTQVFRSSAPENDEGEWAFASYLLVKADDCTFNNLGMIIYNLFKSAC